MNQQHTTRINWAFPPPRKGFRGALDTFIGPGATRAELVVQGILTILGGMTVIGLALWSGATWSPVQMVLAGLLALDMVGGIVTNATSSAKRWYHREGQGFWRHFGFTSLHIVHIFLVAWLFRDMDWHFLVLGSIFLLTAATLILKTPLYLQRPVALFLFAMSLPLTQYAFSPTPGLEWFLPFLFLKLLVSHLLREEPYRPVWE